MAVDTIIRSRLPDASSVPTELQFKQPEDVAGRFVRRFALSDFQSDIKSLLVTEPYQRYLGYLSAFAVDEQEPWRQAFGRSPGGPLGSVSGSYVWQVLSRIGTPVSLTGTYVPPDVVITSFTRSNSPMVSGTTVVGNVTGTGPVPAYHMPTEPPTYPELIAALEESRSMLAWDEGWAGASNPRILEGTWQRAEELILHAARRLWEITGRTVPVPAIMPVGDGSIDIEWEREGRNLLINIPVDPEKAPTFYARDAQRRFPIEGELDTSVNNEWLLMWMWT